jgi:hypothetical protein
MSVTHEMERRSRLCVCDGRCGVDAAIKDRPAPAALRRDKPKLQPNATRQSGERDGGLAGLTQLEALPAVPAGRIAHMLDYAQSNAASLQVVRRCAKPCPHPHAYRMTYY